MRLDVRSPCRCRSGADLSRDEPKVGGYASAITARVGMPLNAILPDDVRQRRHGDHGRASHAAQACDGVFVSSPRHASDESTRRRRRQGRWRTAGRRLAKLMQAGRCSDRVRRCAERDRHPDRAGGAGIGWMTPSK